MYTSQTTCGNGQINVPDHVANKSMKQPCAGFHTYRRKFGSQFAKLPTTWTNGKAQPGRSSGMEKVTREKIRDGEYKRWRI